MVMMPITVMTAMRGLMANSPRISSMSRLPISCSMVPMHRNSSALETAWKMISRMPAVSAVGVLMPAQAMIRPRLEMVE